MLHKIGVGGRGPFRRLSSSRSRWFSVAAVLTALLLGQQSAVAETGNNATPTAIGSGVSVKTSTTHDVETEASRKALEGLTPTSNASIVVGSAGGLSGEVALNTQQRLFR